MEAEQTPPMSKAMAFLHTPAAKMLTLMVGGALIVSVMAGIWLWSKQPDYRVLFTNFSGKDGGAIVASLEQMNVPYKISEGGNVIMAPADQVHEVRLKLATQGLPQGGGVGFELMETQKLGISQFLEQVNFQRALEGEMARSIQSIGAVKSARIHLALHKPSVFVRNKPKPTASVLLNLHAGRAMDRSQVNAIVHLVASSVPNLLAGNVTVVDQHGNLLSDTDKNNDLKLDPKQLKYIHQLEKSIVHRVESIISPIVGPENVRAEATADVDFSRTDQAAEIYKPNQRPNYEPAVRSQQTAETQTVSKQASGIPGAYSNQPPQNVSAPINASANAGAASAPLSVPINKAVEATTNYEVDKTIRYTQGQAGGIKRLTVAVVVNYKKTTDKKGKVKSVPLSEEEKTQITALVKEAMGFNQERGDSLNVLNTAFAKAAIVEEVKVPLWKQESMINLAIKVGKYVLAGLVILYLFFAYLRPLLKKLSKINPTPEVESEEKDDEEEYDEEEDDEEEEEEDEEVAKAKIRAANYENNLATAKKMAKEEPKAVANVVKGWVGENE